MDELKKPLWFKMWMDKYIYDFDIEFITDTENYSEKQQTAILIDVGKAFVNAVNVFNYYEYYTGDDEGIPLYNLNTPEGKKLFRNFKSDIKQAYDDYYKRVENGKEGGRPPKDKTNG